MTSNSLVMTRSTMRTQEILKEFFSWRYGHCWTIRPASPTAWS